MKITEDSLASLDTYASIPSSFLVREVFDVVDNDSAPGGVLLVRRALKAPYTKDYDSPVLSHPTRWAEQFDLTHWGFLSGSIAGTNVAKAAIAWKSPGVDLLDDREDVVMLWDIRVAPEFQRQGIGTLMFRAAEKWSADRHARRLKVETQNINVAACDFYARQGCVLSHVDRSAYADFPDEVQLLWCKDIPDRTV